MGLVRLAKAGMAACAMIVSVPAAVVGMCLQPLERTAVETRALQTELMVAALSCGARADYNAFVGRYKDVLVDSGLTLRQMFLRDYGRNGQRQLDSFITGLANAASARSIAKGGTFCEESRDIFDRALLGGGRGGIGAIMAERSFAIDYGIGGCAPVRKARAREDVASTPK